MVNKAVKFENLNIMNLYKIFRYQGKLYREYSENQYKSHCSSCINK